MNDGSEAALTVRTTNTGKLAAKHRKHVADVLLAHGGGEPSFSSVVSNPRPH